jgi:peptidase E
MHAVVLGPQHAQPSVAAVLREVAGAGPVALITAGLQERESESSAIPELGVPAINLTLHARGDAVFAKDPALAAGFKARQTRLRLMQDFYRARLEHANLAARAISVRHVDEALLAEEGRVSMAVIQRLDQDHLDRCREVYRGFDERWQPGARALVARHRGEVAAILERTTAVVIAGGHVAVLLNRIRMFDLEGVLGKRPVIGWSAGAMILTDRIVLFHDQPPYGQPIAEVLDSGLGLAPDLVVLPNPRLRLHLDDAARVSHYAQRFAPATCVALDHGARLDVRDGRVVGGRDAQRLRADGSVDKREPSTWAVDPAAAPGGAGSPSSRDSADGVDRGSDRGGAAVADRGSPPSRPLAPRRRRRRSPRAPSTRSWPAHIPRRPSRPSSPAISSPSSRAPR